MRTVRRYACLLASKELSLFAIDQVAQRPALHIECLRLVEVGVVGRRGCRLSSHTRVRRLGLENLTTRERVAVSRYLPCDKVAIEEVPTALVVDVRPLQRGHCVWCASLIGGEVGRRCYFRLGPFSILSQLV